MATKTQKHMHHDQPQTRLETGLVKLGNDWRGVFLRGDDAMFKGIRLGAILEAYLNGRSDADLGFIERQNVAVLKELRDLFLSVDESRNTDPPVQHLKNYAECS